MNILKETLIDEEILINIVNNSASSNSLRTMQLQSLHLLLELHLHTSPGTAKELLLQVTDESNPLLLLSTSITENGYQHLRSSQGLLVDFSSFPHHLSNLVKKCREEQKLEAPKFALILRTTANDIPTANDGGIGKVSLEVVELNEFKHLCHLSLSLAPATMQIKLAHLSSCIKMLKNSLSIERGKSRNEVARLKEEVEALHGTHSKKSLEWESSREEMQRKMALEVEKYSHMLMQEKEASLKTRSDCDRRLAREKKELEGKFAEQIRELKDDNKSLSRKNSELTNENEQLEADLRGMRHKLTDMEEKSKRYTKDLNNLAKERADLKRESDIKEDSNRKLINQVAQQEKTIQELDRVVKQNSSQFAVLNQEKKLLQESLESCKMKLEKREENLRKLLVDFQKSLEIIKKFKQKIQSSEQKIDSLLNTTEAQEGALVEKERELLKVKQEKKELNKTVSAAQTELEEKEEKLKEATEKITNQESDLKRNENVITWLNKRLNEIETNDALVRRAPLAEAYLQSRSLRAKFNALTPTVATSTPLLSHSGTQNFTGSTNKAHSLQSAGHAVYDIPRIEEEAEENGPQTEEEKENAKGLDPRYMEPSQQKVPPFPVRGILRANARSKPEPKTDTSKNAATRFSDKKMNKTNAPKPRVPSKPSAYFTKT